MIVFGNVRIIIKICKIIARNPTEGDARSNYQKYDDKAGVFFVPGTNIYHV